MQLNPYLHFDGNCEEALAFYASAIGGSIEGLHRYEGSPMEAEVGAGYKQKVMHATLVAGELRLMASDTGPGRPPTTGSNLTLSLWAATPEEGQRAFDALVQSGSVDMPLQEVFWGGRFGMLTDRYGFHWMVSTE